MRFEYGYLSFVHTIYKINTYQPLFTYRCFISVGIPRVPGPSDWSNHAILLPQRRPDLHPWSLPYLQCLAIEAYQCSSRRLHLRPWLFGSHGSSAHQLLAGIFRHPSPWVIRVRRVGYGQGRQPQQRKTIPWHQQGGWVHTLTSHIPSSLIPRAFYLSLGLSLVCCVAF